MVTGGLPAPPPPRPSGRQFPSNRRWNISMAIQLLALLSIAILVTFAVTVRNHVVLSDSNAAIRDGSQHGAPQSDKKLKVPPPAEEARKRVQKEIASLENELDEMGKKYMEVGLEFESLKSSLERVATKKARDVANVEGDQRASDGDEKQAQQAPLTPPKPQFEEREPKRWWIQQEVFDMSDYSSEKSSGGEEGAIIPIDLSVNHLQRIEQAGGSPNDISSMTVEEEFLPVVLPSDIEFRWRSKVRPGSKPGDAIKTSAYRIVARRAHSSKNDGGGDGAILWDTGRVETANGLPDVVKWNTFEHEVAVGTVVEWRVSVWDSSTADNPNEPSVSRWSKFAVGPSDDEWQGKWISHPLDVDSFEKTDSAAFWKNDDKAQEIACSNWERRSQPPLFRAKISSYDLYKDGSDDDEIATALLVISGLGSFRASIDGEPLSSSGPLDPPFTDYAQRVSYRGFDITNYFTKGDNKENTHVIGVTMGSGWWDHRPIKGSFIRLFLLPRGAITCIAQIYVTYKSGKTEVLLPTGNKASGWQVAKGPIRESSLFTGEYIDLKSMASFDGWDTDRQWATISPNNEDQHSWVEPVAYESDTTLRIWRYQLEFKAAALSKPDDSIGPIQPKHKLAPIGKLIPIQAPPVMPTERLYPDEIYSLGDGRWMIDFGKGISGVLRFESGLPDPIVPPNGKYPRAHNMATLGPNDKFITVVHGESLEMTTGDINLAVVAGMGLHDSGPQHKSREAGWAESKGGPCYPKDHDAGSLLQRDVYILPANEEGSNQGSFSDARQSHFTTHSFRFAEICCTTEPPTGITALAYRTAFAEWGNFASSNVRLNGGYELIKNAMNSNMLSVQSDCPHREKIQYGGDIIADSPAAMHWYDLSAFYRKAIFDWVDQQWDNGAYAGTSYWLNLNDYAGIGQGAGETVWATAPLVMTARHMWHYGDLKLLNETMRHHMEWMRFLLKNFDDGMKKKGYDEELKGYVKEGSGLGDWLTFRGRDTWLTHQSFYMAAARCIAYISAKLGQSNELSEMDDLAKSVEGRIARIYLKNGKDYFTPPEAAGGNLSPGPEMSLFSRVVPGEKRCTVLRNYFRREGHTWPGSDEKNFLNSIDDDYLKEMITTGEVSKRGKDWSMGWSQWQGFNEGILAVKYSLKTLSDNGFHNVALNKASGFGCGSFEYMLSHNATTMWESWWRSEDLYSHNHPMLGASAEWMVSSVAGVGLHPKTTGGSTVLFWPRFPNSANVLEFAGATQGTRRGDFSIAWKFEDLPDNRDLYASASVTVHIRLFVPPDGKSVLRIPEYSNGEGVDASMKYATSVPNLDEALMLSSEECLSRRDAKMGFSYNFEFSNKTRLFSKVERKKAIGTPCHSFLFHSTLDDTTWGETKTVTGISTNGIEVPLVAGLYDILVSNWQLRPEVATSNGRIGSIPDYFKSEDVGPYCADSDTFDWNIEDASHLI